MYTCGKFVIKRIMGEKHDKTHWTLWEAIYCEDWVLKFNFINQDTIQLQISKSCITEIIQIHKNCQYIDY